MTCLNHIILDMKRTINHITPVVPVRINNDPRIQTSKQHQRIFKLRDLSCQKQCRIFLFWWNHLTMLGTLPWKVEKWLWIDFVSMKKLLLNYLESFILNNRPQKLWLGIALSSKKQEKRKERSFCSCDFTLNSNISNKKLNSHDTVRLSTTREHKLRSICLKWIRKWKISPKTPSKIWFHVFWWYQP